MESIAEDTPALRRWFNIEPVADKGALQELLDRVSGTGYEALLVNVDCRAIGHRERDYRRLHGTADPAGEGPSPRRAASRLGVGVSEQRRDRLSQPGRRRSDGAAGH
jgi:hypothetical protein